MSFAIFKKSKSCVASFAVILATVGMGCTQSVPSQFKAAPADNTEAATLTVSEEKVETTKIPVDMLWVVDNSASMLTSQEKLRDGLSSFARKYLSGSKADIQLAVITTDAFVANEAWAKYLNEPNPATKKTPLQVHAEKDRGAAQWGPNYAKLSASALMSTKKSGLVSSFQSRVLVGTQGIYEEHGLDSVEQFIIDNEKGSSPNKLFRKGSLRVIVFLSDENDQSMGYSANGTMNAGPEPRKLLYSGSYYTGADAAKAAAILPAHFSINCPGDANVKGAKATANTAMTICVRGDVLEPVSGFKNRLDAFFRNLDGNPNGNPNYLVTAIIGEKDETIAGLRNRTTEKNSETGLTVITNEKGTRYSELVATVGNGSFAMDIGATNYAPILDKIGLEISNRSTVVKSVPKTTFKLDRAVDTTAKVIVTIEFASGKTIVLSTSQYQISGNKFVITDQSLTSVLQPGDRITVVYQPATVLPASN